MEFQTFQEWINSVFKVYFIKSSSLLDYVSHFWIILRPRFVFFMLKIVLKSQCIIRYFQVDPLSAPCHGLLWIKYVQISDFPIACEFLSLRHIFGTKHGFVGYYWFSSGSIPFDLDFGPFSPRFCWCLLVLFQFPFIFYTF